MLRKALVLAVVAASLLLPFSSRAATTDSGAINITATVDPYFVFWNGATINKTQWSIVEDTDISLATGDKIDKINKTLYAAVTLTLITNANADITIATGDATLGKLTKGVDFLRTSYTIQSSAGSITGMAGHAVANVYVDSADLGLPTNMWRVVPNVAGNTDIIFKVRADATGANTNPAAGDYATTVTVVATW